MGDHLSLRIVKHSLRINLGELIIDQYSLNVILILILLIVRRIDNKTGNLQDQED